MLWLEMLLSLFKDCKGLLAPCQQQPPSQNYQKTQHYKLQAICARYFSLYVMFFLSVSECLHLLEVNLLGAFNRMFMQ